MTGDTPVVARQKGFQRAPPLPTVSLELFTGLLFLLAGLAVRERTVLVLPEASAGFVGTRLLAVGGILTATALGVQAGVLPDVALQAATLLVLVLALVTVVERRRR